MPHIIGHGRYARETYPEPKTPGGGQACGATLLRFAFDTWGPDLAPSVSSAISFSTPSIPPDTTVIEAWVENPINLPVGVGAGYGEMDDPTTIRLFLDNLSDGVIGGLFPVTFIVACWNCPVIPGVVTPS